MKINVHLLQKDRNDFQTQKLNVCSANGNGKNAKYTSKLLVCFIFANINLELV